MEKRGKEIKINLPFDYRTKIGTIDNKEPDVIYLTVSGWGTPIVESDNYQKCLSVINKQLRQTLYKQIPKHRWHNDKFISYFDMRSSGVAMNKKSFMNLEVTLYQKENVKITDKNLQKDATQLLIDIVDVLDNNGYFKFTKAKK